MVCLQSLKCLFPDSLTAKATGCLLPFSSVLNLDTKIHPRVDCYHSMWCCHDSVNTELSFFIKTNTRTFLWPGQCSLHFSYCQICYVLYPPYFKVDNWKSGPFIMNSSMNYRVNNYDNWERRWKKMEQDDSKVDEWWTLKINKRKWKPDIEKEIQVDGMSCIKSVLQQERGENLSLLAFCGKKTQHSGVPLCLKQFLFFEISEFKVKMKTMKVVGKDELRSQKNWNRQSLMMFFMCKVSWEQYTDGLTG